MTRSFCLLFALVVTAFTSSVPGSGPIDPDNPPQGRFSDEWAEVFMAGGKVGYMHSTMAREGDLIHSAMNMEIELARLDQAVKIRVLEQSTETLIGVPLSFETTTDMSMMKTIMKGKIEDGQVTITSSQFGLERTQVFDYPAGAVMTWGGYRETLRRGFEPGTEYVLRVYLPSMRLDDAVEAKMVIGDWEDITHRGRSLRGQRVTVVLTTPAGSMELVSWVDRHGSTVKAVLPIPGLGNLEIVTTDQRSALADFIPAELFMTTTIKAKRSLEPAALQRVKYRITTKSPEVKLGDLPTTGMQQPGAKTEHSVEVVLTRQSHKPQSDRAPPPPPADMAEYLQGNLMINVDDPELIKLARQAAGSETEPFALADKLRRFVTNYVKDKSLSIGFATAGEVCRNKQGDCSEHGVLLAALGRLSGLPSRVAVGVAYVPLFGKRRDIFGYHMWTQFFIDGRWIDVDAAIPETVCSPTRIAFATSSLKNAGLADLSLPLLTKIGAIDIDILEVQETADPND